MRNYERRYYFGSYGLVRGYGPICRTIEEADFSVLEDGRKQRSKGGSTDRNAVVVSRATGLCWWMDEHESDLSDEVFEEIMAPVRMPNGEQARYLPDRIRYYEALWGSPTEMAGFA